MNARRIAVTASLVIALAVMVHAAASRRSAGPRAFEDPARVGRLRPADRTVQRSTGAAAPTTRAHDPAGPAVAPAPWDGPTILAKLRKGSAADKQEALRLLAGSRDLPLVRQAVAALCETWNRTSRLQAVDLIRSHALKEEAPRLVDMVSQRSAGPILRDQAAIALSELENLDVAPDLRKLYAEGDVPARRLAAQILQDLGDPGYVPDFVRQAAVGLGDRSPERLGHRLVLVAEASRVTDPGVRPVMLGALSDPCPAIRYHGIQWLGDHGGAEDVAGLDLLRADPDPEVRHAVEEALGKIKSRTNG